MGKLFQFAFGFTCSVGYSLFIIEEFHKSTQRQLHLLDMIEKDAKGEIMMRPDSVDEDLTLSNLVMDRYKNKWLAGVTRLTK